MVDSCDADRLPTSREEFQAILEEEELKVAAILVYANKQVCGRGGRRRTREGRGRGGVCFSMLHLPKHIACMPACLAAAAHCRICRAL